MTTQPDHQGTAAPGPATLHELRAVEQDLAAAEDWSCVSRGWPRSFGESRDNRAAVAAG
ncbi:hypothetical protein ACFVVA_40210 [Kitasatospora sp. NPDC058048]|uniref:hypothetical protein n=1 Tax=Kitasatospora sp. NPDC058048 TaxID=3346313 RepID=UPI0036D878F6